MRYASSAQPSSTAARPTNRQPARHRNVNAASPRMRLGRARVELTSWIRTFRRHRSCAEDQSSMSKLLAFCATTYDLSYTRILKSCSKRCRRIYQAQSQQRKSLRIYIFLTLNTTEHFPSFQEPCERDHRRLECVRHELHLERIECILRLTNVLFTDRQTRSASTN